ncbi:MAG: hypothetical protein H0U74_00520 [Bradymonadaceae bacterium]|nr:hypothetical protein [Lujinxingiaceae bacterium]
MSLDPWIFALPTWLIIALAALLALVGLALVVALTLFWRAQRDAEQSRGAEIDRLYQQMLPMLAGSVVLPQIRRVHLRSLLLDATVAEADPLSAWSVASREARRLMLALQAAWAGGGWEQSQIESVVAEIDARLDEAFALVAERRLVDPKWDELCEGFRRARGRIEKVGNAQK